MSKLKLMLVLGLFILLMFQPVAYAETVRVIADRISDEFIWDMLAGEVASSVGLRDLQYISFSDIINVKIRRTEDSLLMTWHVLGEVPTTQAEDSLLNFAYFIWMSPTEEGLLNFPYPGDYPFVAVIIECTYQIRPIYWWGEVIVLTSSTEGQRYSLDYIVNKRTLDASISSSLLPFTEFHWLGGTTYQNRTLRDNALALHDLTNIAYFG